MGRSPGSGVTTDLKAKDIVNLKELCMNPHRMRMPLELMQRNGMFNLQRVHLYNLMTMEKDIEQLIKGLICAPNLQYLSIGLSVGAIRRAHRHHHGDVNVATLDGLCSVFGACRDALGQRVGSSTVLRFACDEVGRFDWNGSQGDRLGKEMVETVRTLKELGEECAVGWKFRSTNERRCGVMHKFLDSMVQEIKEDLELKVERKVFMQTEKVDHYALSELETFVVHKVTVSNVCTLRGTASETFQDRWCMGCENCSI